MSAELPDLHDVNDFALSGVPVRAYTPTADASFPVIALVHQGGSDTVDTADRDARALAHARRAIVMSVGRGDDADDAAAAVDALAVLRAVVANGRNFGWDGNPIEVHGGAVAELVVAGAFAEGLPGIVRGGISRS